MELFVVMSITIILTSMLLPALARLKENALKLHSTSNMRQIGFAIHDYAREHSERLPKSRFVTEVGKRSEMMAAYVGDAEVEDSDKRWDGLGLLYRWGYLPFSECFYNPAHAGDHPHDRYAQSWIEPGLDTLYTNYHYIGDRVWFATDDGNSPKQGRRITLDDRRSSLALVTDGLRTKSDFTFVDGYHTLHTDASVRWTEDITREVHRTLPADLEEFSGAAADEIIFNVWQRINPIGFAVQ